MITITSIQTSKLNLPSLLEIVNKEARKEAEKIQKEFGGTVKTWKKKPKFTITMQEGGSYEIGTDNPIYGFVDQGTKPHIIRAKNAPYLSFYRTGFVSKTKPNSLNNRAGRKATQDFTQVKQVNHPGTEPRNFTKLIRNRSQKRYPVNVAKAIKQKMIWGKG